MYGKTLLIVCLLLMTISRSPASVMVTFTPSPTSISPGSTFSLTVNLQSTAGEVMAGADFRVQVNSTGSGLFTVTGRTSTGSIYTSGISAVAGEVLNPANASGLGAYDGNFVGVRGTAYMCTLTIVPSNATPLDTYTFTPVDIDVIDPQFNSFRDVAGLAAAIPVFPEPTVLAWLGLGSLFLWRRRG